MLLAVIFALCCIVTCYGSPTLIFTTSKDIRVANISRPSRVTTIVKDLSAAVAVDFYYEGKQICWTDSTGIHCVTYNGTHAGNKVNIVTSGIVIPDGIACDWLTKKLYWTDGDLRRIEVTTLDGKYKTVLFWEEIDQPRAIALVPTESLMFWTDWGEVPKIERASMDGDPNSRKIIVSDNLFWPNGLTIDYESRKIYWLDGKLLFVDVMDFEGRNRRTITEKGVLYPVSIALFKEKLYWTSWDTSSIHMLDRNSGGESRELIHSSDHIPIDIQIMEQSRQPYKETPCKFNNGGCSHLCLLSTKQPGYTCSCPTGVKLIDNHTCHNGPQEFIILVQMMEISLISLDTPDHTVFTIPLKGVKHAFAIDYDPVNGHMYWTDDEAHQIRRARLDGSAQEDVITSELEQPDGLAIDWRAQNLYWTDTGTDRIQVSRINTSFTKVLINSDLVEPRAIALSPDDGLMFWSDWYEKKPKIERGALDGSQRVVLVNDHLGWPNGIALDINGQKLFWCDAKTDRIEVINYDGTGRREVITENTVHVFGLSLLGDYLYWTDWQRRSIDSAHKESGANRTLILDQMAHLMGLKVIGPIELPTKYNPCAENNGNCSHLCLNTPTTYVCACQMGYELAGDRRSCIVPEAFLLFTQKENIGRISIKNAHNDAIIPVSGIKDASALDFDINDSRIYWTDVKAKAITRAYINGSHVERIIEFGLESPEGLAVDWIAHNIYWTDTGTKRIEVARLDGLYRRTIIWTDLQEPRSIVVDPSQGYIYWSEWASPGSLHRANLDGTGGRVLIGRLGRANSLTIDRIEKRIYWCALQGFVESAALDGSQRIQVTSSPSPFTMSLYQDKIYLSDWQTGELYSASKHSGANKTVLHSKLEKVTSVVVYHSWGQSIWSPCAHDGACSHLCLNHCACPTHYTLHHNKCIPPTSFMLVSTKNTIKRLVLNSTECPDAPLPIHGLKNVKAIEYDLVQETLYWVDGRTHGIKRWSSNSGSTQPSVVIPKGGGGAHSLALDPYSRVLFWSSPFEGTINATKLDNGSMTPPSSVVVVYSHQLEKPKRIAVHPFQGLLFWESVGRDTRIYRCRLDGTRRTTLVAGLEDITALTIDTQENILYWATRSTIESCNIHGDNRRIITSQHVKETPSLAVMGQFLFWLHMQAVISMNRHTREIKTAFGSHHHLTSLVAVAKQSKKVDTRWECLSGERVDSYIECNRDVGGGGGPCENDQFACLGSPGDCVPIKWRCDGFSDCRDLSDESNCPLCDSNQFTCRNGQCVDVSLVCDGTPDCKDNSDEMGCCMGIECGGRCVLWESVCDLRTDCSDASDESASACTAKNSAAGGERRRLATAGLGSNGGGVSSTSSPSGSYIVVIFGAVVVICLVIAAFLLLFKRNSRLKPGNGCVGSGGRLEGDPAMDPLSPPPHPPLPRGGASHSVRMSNLLLLGGGGESRGGGGSRMGGGGSSGGPQHSIRCYPPLNPPPSPATTSKESRRPLYRPPPPTPCSTDVCHETDSNYQGDSEPLPPPPTPTSLSPSPSSSTYFHPVPPPPPSPTP